MFSFFKSKKEKLDPDVYRETIITQLKEDGFDPKWLDDLMPDEAGLKVDRVFKMLHHFKLDPRQATKAIEVATHFYNKTKEEAEADGWPLRHTDKVPAEYTRQECYLLEQLTDAITVILKKKKTNN